MQIRCAWFLYFESRIQNAVCVYQIREIRRQVAKLMENSLRDEKIWRSSVT